MAEPTLPITGGCLCGAVRYEADEPPSVSYCHCRMCQLAYGALYGLFAVVPLAAFRYTQGEPTYYQSSPWAKRGFCANCGSPVDFRYADSEMLGLMIGTLDDPGDWPPDSHHNGIESKVAWHVITDDLPQRRSDESDWLKAAKASARDEADPRD